jgi:hypothetical protein
LNYAAPVFQPFGVGIDPHWSVLASHNGPDLSWGVAPPRPEFPGAIYHLTSRGNGREKIFHPPPLKGHTPATSLKSKESLSLQAAMLTKKTYRVYIVFRRETVKEEDTEKLIDERWAAG